MPKILPQSFYARETHKVAQRLLGKTVVSLKSGQKIVATITETEAYHGYNDKACHGHKGKTPRTEPMFDTIGSTYIYLCYGIHWMLNVSTYQKYFPAAVLIRGVYDHTNRVHYDGPGKLTKYLQLTKKDNQMPVYTHNSSLQIYDSKQKPQYAALPRVGIDYAEESKDWPWRFSVPEAELRKL